MCTWAAHLRPTVRQEVDEVIEVVPRHGCCCGELRGLNKSGRRRRFRPGNRGLSELWVVGVVSKLRERLQAFFSTGDLKLLQRNCVDFPLHGGASGSIAPSWRQSRCGIQRPSSTHKVATKRSLGILAFSCIKAPLRIARCVHWFSVTQVAIRRDCCLCRARLLAHALRGGLVFSRAHNAQL